MRYGAILITTLILLMGPGAVAAPKAVPVEQAMKAAAGGATAKALAEKSSGLIHAGDSRGLAAHLRAMKADPDLDPAVRERLLHKTTLSASGMDPDEDLRREVETLTGYQSQTWVWTDEHGHRETRPLYDVAAAARQTGRKWAENDARKSAQPLLARSDTSIVLAYARGDAIERKGLELAFGKADADQLAAQRDELSTALADGEPVGELAAISALRTGDAALMRQVIAEAAPDVALRSVRRIDVGEWPGQSSGLLAEAARRPETASAALLALGRRTGADPGATAQLFSALGQPAGASAAAALARTGSDDVARQLGAILGSAGYETTRRHALLGLRLMDSATAEDELRAFARDPASPPALVTEVPSWLRD
jgi:hypothetical protein